MTPKNSVFQLDSTGVFADTSEMSHSKSLRALSTVAFVAGLLTGLSTASAQFIQSSNQSITSTSASVTSLDGFPASISSQTIRPFVTGITPVVSGYAYGVPTRDNSSQQMFQANQQSQREYLRSRAAANANAKQERALQSAQRGWRAEQSGNLRQARANYRSALAAAQGPLRFQIMQRMRQRGWR